MTNHPQESSTFKTTSSLPLTKTIICLSGYTTTHKNTLHTQIQSLGGTYVRDLDTSIVTHLLVYSSSSSSGKESAKYKQAAKKRMYGGGGSIEILTEEWLQECCRRKKRVKEGRFRVLKEEVVDDRSVCDVVEDCMYDFEHAASGTETIRKRKRRMQRSSIFSSCHFLFIGYDDDDDDDDDAPNNKQKNASLKEREETKKSLCTLIRKGRGVVHWNVSDMLTHVVVCEDCDDGTRNAVLSFCRNHPNCLQPISHQWIIDSFQQQILLPFFKYLPKPKPKPIPKNIPPPAMPPPQDRTTSFSRSSSIQSTSSMVASSRLNAPCQNSSLANSSSSSIFQGCVFVILRQKPPSHTIDFDISQLERSIQSHGGHILSRKIIVALQKDAASVVADRDFASVLPPPPGLERVCYVVSLGGPGGYSISTTTGSNATLPKNNPILQCHPLLSELIPLSSSSKRQTLRIRIVSVTPTWVSSCIKRKWEIPPDEYPFLFQPLHFYVHCFPIGGIVPRQVPKRMRKKQQKEALAEESSLLSGRTKLRVALTGFVGLERIGIVHILQSMGAIYTEDLTYENTHLLCPETTTTAGNTSTKTNKSAKFEKACQWGLYVVSIDWLYHVMQYGYYGKEKKSLEEEHGCEDLFSLVPLPSSHSLSKGDEDGMNGHDGNTKQVKKNVINRTDSTSIPSDDLNDTNRDESQCVSDANMPPSQKLNDCSSSTDTPVVNNNSNISQTTDVITNPGSAVTTTTTTTELENEETVTKMTNNESEGQEQEDKKLLRSALRHLEAPIVSSISSSDRKSLSSSASRKRRDRSPPSRSLSLHHHH
mmetsp:Transcript_40549/g.60760  ORF Transcript_40549/g.60760 Transcript_40549/m.60760 type:complete len:818 (-) Transcript_40549:2985-5438(-)